MNILPAVGDSEATVGIIVAIIFVLIYLVMGVLAFASYILNALSLYTIGSRRLIKNSWLSWLPIGKEYILGKIAEEYDSKNGIKRKWGKILLTLNIIGYAGFAVFFVLYFVVIILALVGVNVDGFDFARLSPSSGVFILGMVLFILGYIAAMICLMASQFLSYICYFKLFESTIPEKAVKYLLISLLVPFGMPICLYKAKDQGYFNVPEFLQPPVVAAPQEETPVTEEITAEPVAEQEQTVAEQPAEEVAQPQENTEVKPETTEE